ncbi:MAG: DUF3127 domain-containing protein [Bacteroidales bacterium]
MSVVITGKLLQILPRQNGTGKNGPWVKQDFIIETPGEFSRKICISAWGDKAGDIDGLKEGDELKVSVNIESREFNERWYTDVKAWRIEKTAAGGENYSSSVKNTPPPPEDIPPADDELLPF